MSRKLALAREFEGNRAKREAQRLAKEIRRTKADVVDPKGNKKARG